MLGSVRRFEKWPGRLPLHRAVIARPHDEARRRHAPLQEEGAHHLDAPFHHGGSLGLGPVEVGCDQEAAPRLEKQSLRQCRELLKRLIGRLRLFEGQLGKTEPDVLERGFGGRGVGIWFGRPYFLIILHRRELSLILLRRGWWLLVLSRRGSRLLICQPRLDGRLTQSPSQQPGLRPSDLRRGTRFGEGRPLTGDVREMFDLSARGPGAGCGACLFQRDLGQIQLGRSQGAHARGAARAVDRRMRLIESRMRGWAGTAGCRQREQTGNRG